MLILCFLVLQVLPASFCFNVELQGKVKVANNLLGALRQPSELIDLILSYLPDQIVGKGKLPKYLETISIPYLRASKNSNEIKQMENQIPDLPMKIMRTGHDVTPTLLPLTPLEEFMKHLQETGKDTIEAISKAVTLDLGTTKNITPILTVVTNDYKNMLQNYYDYVKKDQDNADRDLLFLDMVETSCRLLFDEEKKLLNDIIMHENNNHHENYKKITQELLKQSYVYKRETMRYICDYYKICKEYPAVSDYGANLISEILMLNDKKFRKVLEVLAKILKEKDSIFSRISEKEDRKLICEKFKEFKTDLFATKEFFAFVRALITQRFKPVTGNAEFRMKTRATRMLLDIFDKALNAEDDVISIDADNCFQAIKKWAAHERDDIEDILSEFVNNLIIRLNHNLTKNARREIRLLLRAVIRGSTEAIEDLLKSGSVYLKGKDFHSDVDILLD